MGWGGYLDGVGQGARAERVVSLSVVGELPEDARVQQERC